MKRLLVGSVLALCLMLAPMTAHAAGLDLGITGSTETNPSPVPVPPPKGPEANVSGDFTGSIDEEGNFLLEIGPDGLQVELPFETFNPKVTRLHSVNAMFADAGYDVYFLPVLSDFPIKLSDLALDTTSTVGNKRHQFAIVYDGDYDREVLFQQATSSGPKVSHYMTSKKVYNANNSSRALNLLGYDFLLQEEHYDIEVRSGGGYENLWANYTATPLNGNQPIDTQTAVMDIYKALGVYEWDIQFAFTRNNKERYGTFDINKHPMVTQLPAIVGINKTQGLDISELETYVAATRTNPTLYWERARRDCLFISGLNSVSSDEAGVTGTTGLHLTAETPISYIDFLTLCANMMYLYGEPVMTASEARSVLTAMQITIPASCSQEQSAALSFMVAKGVVGSDELDGLYNQLTREQLLTTLLRVADKDSRLSYSPETGYMFSRGFIDVDNISIVDNVQHYSFNSEDYVYMYDYLVEKKDEKTRYLVQSMAAEVVTRTGEQVSTDASTPGFNANDLLYEDKDYYSYWTDEGWVSILHNNEQAKRVEWLSDVVLKGKEFYHFRVDSRTFENGITLGLDVHPSENGEYYEASHIADIAEIYPYDNMNPYQLQGGGGIYVFEGDTLKGYPFDRAVIDGQGYKIDSSLLDEKRSDAISGDVQLSSSWVVDIFIVSGNVTPADLPIIKDSTDTYDYRQLCTADGFREGRHDICPGKMYATVALQEDDTWRVEIFTDKEKTDKRPTDHNPFSNTSPLNGLDGFYRGEDGTLLVSLQTLIDKNIVNFYTSHDFGYVLTLGDKKTAVTLYQNEDRKYAYVGETLLMLPQDETLYEIVDNDIYVSYKACTGWASDYVAVYNRDYVTYYKSESETKVSTRTLALPFSRYGAPTLTVSYPGAMSNAFPAVDMMANNPMSNYLLVQQSDASYSDVLFVVRVNEPNTVYYGGTHLEQCLGVSQQLSGPDATNLFTRVTRGLSYQPPDFCELYAYVLSPDTDFVEPYHNDIILNSTPVNELPISNAGSEEIRQIFGYYYYLANIDASYVNGSINAYYGSTNKRLIPICTTGGGREGWSYVNINLNHVKPSNVEDMKPAGIYVECVEPDDMEIAEITEDDMITRLTKVTDMGGTVAVSPEVRVNNDYSIVPAPTGCFAQLRGLPYIASEDINETSTTDRFFYGSTPVVKSRTSNLWFSSNLNVDLSNVDWYCIYYNPFGSIYAAVTSEFGQVTASYQKTYDSLSSTVKDREENFDWDAYTFGRLAEGVDRWSSVLLIAILNLLPRVGIFFFLLLIPLASASNTKMMVRFCHSYFDIYKILTAGHMTVDACDAKRLLLTSIFAIGIFSMIMDGLIIKIVTFVCSGITELIHR